jgi:hypothetical protein
VRRRGHGEARERARQRERERRERLREKRGTFVYRPRCYIIERPDDRFLGRRALSTRNATASKPTRGGDGVVFGRGELARVRVAGPGGRDRDAAAVDASRSEESTRGVC